MRDGVKRFLICAVPLIQLAAGIHCPMVLAAAEPVQAADTAGHCRSHIEVRHGSPLRGHDCCHAAGCQCPCSPPTTDVPVPGTLTRITRSAVAPAPDAPPASAASTELFKPPIA